MAECDYRNMHRSQLFFFSLFTDMESIFHFFSLNYLTRLIALRAINYSIQLHYHKRRPENILSGIKFYVR